ncbi:hypothetical protein N7454_004022 [Penicillium verhagenii]|nr:hypothetical protein N7454_004022 [Penicillium verhagenii]
MYILPWLLSLVAVSSAAPANFFDDAYDFSEELLGYYGKLFRCGMRYIQNIASILCIQPPKPDWPQAPNYTCADSTTSSAPVAIGAVANLYNATCIAANYPEVLQMLPSVTYTISLPTNEYATFPPANIELMGHHFFYNSTTPEFNLDTTTQKQYGIAMTNKIDSIAAPSTATKGEYGAVTWLYLKTVSGTVGDYKAVYRVDTAAGNSPTTCEGMQSAFEIQYAAVYYFFG